MFFSRIFSFISQPPARLRVVYQVTFVVAFATAILDPFMSGFVRSIVGSESHVGLIYSGALVFSIIVNLTADNIISRLGREKTLVIFLTLLATGYGLLFYTHLALMFVLIYAMIIASQDLIWFANDLSIKFFGRGQKLAFVEGQYYTLKNLGWFVGPVFGGYIISTFDIRTAFVFNTLLVACMLLYFIRRRSRSHDGLRYKASTHLTRGLKKFFSIRPLRGAYAVFFGLYAFYALNGIYLPLLLLDKGATAATIGFIFSLSMLPFILFGYAFNTLAYHFRLEKIFFVLGFGIIAVTNYVIFTQDSIVAIALAAVCGMIGASMIETLIHTYFLRHIKSDESEPLSIFRTAIGLAWLIAPLFGSVVIYFTDLQSVFVAGSCALIIFALFSLTLPHPRHANRWL